MSKLYVVGIGPGSYENMTVRAQQTLAGCDVIVGYTVYVDLIKEHFAGKEFLTTAMRQEVARCALAFERASQGDTVAMICSGDAGVYGMSGLVADVMLCFTMLIVMAGMAAFGATLTLPGIAGIVLTIGMAVDANVLIYERIREEIRLGLTPLAAVRAGFDRAAISITDSNLTTIIATVILYQFGTGPIRGFAVTLSLGIIASMFTAIFVSRAIFEEWARHCGPKGISI